MDSVNVLVHWAGAAALLPDLFQDALVFRRLAEGLGADSEQIVPCISTTVHHAVRGAAAGLPFDDEREEAHLFGLAKSLRIMGLLEGMRTYFAWSIVRCRVIVGWLVFGCLSI